VHLDRDLVPGVALAAPLLAVVLGAAALGQAVDLLAIAGGQLEPLAGRGDVAVLELRAMLGLGDLALDALEVELARSELDGGQGRLARHLARGVQPLLGGVQLVRSASAWRSSPARSRIATCSACSRTVRSGSKANVKRLALMGTAS
jgi:hypothetical protein